MISFGTDFVAGKNRVPRPATGKIALVTFCILNSYTYEGTSNEIDYESGAFKICL
jgi:hypothetical protein